MSPESKAVVALLVMARQTRSLAQWEVAEQVGTSQADVARFETGKVMWGLDKVLQYAKVVGISVFGCQCSKEE